MCIEKAMYSISIEICVYREMYVCIAMYTFIERDVDTCVYIYI